MRTWITGPTTVTFVILLMVPVLQLTPMASANKPVIQSVPSIPLITVKNINLCDNYSELIAATAMHNCTNI